MTTITVNGRTFTHDGSGSVSIVNGEVRIGGVVVTEGVDRATRIEYSGPVADLHCDQSVSVTGSVAGSVTARGSVNCNSVGTSVEAGGSVNCGSVGGDVRAGGSVNCGRISGSVSAAGRVRSG